MSARQPLSAVAQAPSAPLFDPARDLARQREVQIAARRAFVDMKLAFIKVASVLAGSPGARLQLRVRQAQDPADLLVLQHDLESALPEADAGTERLRADLTQQLERFFAQQ